MSEHMFEEIAQRICVSVSALDSRPSIDEYEQQLARQQRLTPFCAEMFAVARDMRARNDLVVYVAGILTGATDADKCRYESAAKVIAQHQKPGARMVAYVPHLNTDPKKHTHVTPEEVRDIDFLMAVLAADVQFNFWHPVSHGNAVEAAWAEVYEVPVVHMASKFTVLSRLIRGMHNIAGVIIYEDFMRDGITAVDRLCCSLEAKFLAG